MLHKIGISKCNKNKLKYFKIYSPFEKITLDSGFKPINNIVSFMVSPKVIDLDVLDFILSSKSALVNVSVELTYKIIYSSKDSKNLHIIDHKCYHIIKIKMPYYIDGLTIHQLLNLKRIKIEIYIEDVSISLQGNKLILISPYILTEVVTLPDYVLALNIEMFNGENNLFVSFKDGSRLVQKTFSRNIKYKNLSWCPYNTEIGYLSNEGGQFGLYTLNIKNKNPFKIKLDFHLGEIQSFCYTSNDTIAFSSLSNEVYEIYIINTKTMAIRKLTNSIHGFSCISPKFNSKSKKIFFVNKQPDGDYLSSINEDGMELNFICKKPYIADFNIHSSGDYIVLLANDNTTDTYKTFIVDSNGINEREIICLKEKHTIKKVLFCPERDFLALCISYDGRDNIYFYDLKTNYVRNITQNKEGVYISDFSFSFSGNILYYSCSKRGNYDVYSISLDDFNVKSIINCFSKNISLVYKGF